MGKTKSEGSQEISFDFFGRTVELREWKAREVPFEPPRSLHRYLLPSMLCLLLFRMQCAVMVECSAQGPWEVRFELVAYQRLAFWLFCFFCFFNSNRAVPQFKTDTDLLDALVCFSKI